MFGFQVLGADGEIILNASDDTTRLVHFERALAGVDGSVNLPEIAGETIAIITLPTGADVTKHPHAILRNGTTVEWYATDNEFMSSSDSIILIYIYT